MWTAVSSGGRVGSFLQLLGVLLIFIFVLFITFYTTKFIAGYQKAQSFNKNLRIIETLRVSQNKYLELVKAGEKYLVIAIGKDSVTLISELAPEEVEELTSISPQASGNFQETLNKAFQGLKDRLPKGRT